MPERNQRIQQCIVKGINSLVNTASFNMYSRFKSSLLCSELDLDHTNECNLYLVISTSYTKETDTFLFIPKEILAGP